MRVESLGGAAELGDTDGADEALEELLVEGRMAVGVEDRT